ncbi:MAG TPA: PQQ-dependent sugar dehydrogenase [Afifellaceae bacterium]|nr:PQQ-dependent sugar dehydrogenase [Afifellaceae bacterium]
MRLLPILAGASALAIASAAFAQEVPQTNDQVAEPGGQLPGNPQIALVKVADGFNDPVGVASAGDGSGRLFVVERVGRVRVVDGDGNVQAEPFLDLTNINPLGSDVQTQFVEQGLYSIAFHPNFSENGYFFVHYASLPFNGDGLVVRFQVDPESPDSLTPERTNETAKVILRIEQPYYNHNGGTITFGPDGYLYITSGDGGWEGDPLEAGQNLNTRLGKILRVDVDVEDENKGYDIPSDNPFLAAQREQLMVLFGITEEEFGTIKTRALPEIWAYGLRNPYMMHFDQESGDLFIADVGQNHWEEINYQPAGSAGGENYGWAIRMGTHAHPLTGEEGLNAEPFGVLPAGQYPHQEPYPGATEEPEGSGCSVQGLGVANYGGMEKVYLAGDWCTGRVFGLGWDGSAWQLQVLTQTDLQFTGGNVGEDGMVYAVNCNCFYLADVGPTENPPGSLWRIVPADEVPEGAETARTVSQQNGEQPQAEQPEAEQPEAEQPGGQGGQPQ